MQHGLTRRPGRAPAGLARPQPLHSPRPARTRPRGLWWKTLFVLALLVTLVLLLTPGDALLAVKVWVASWLPYAREIEQASWTDHGDKAVHFSLFTVLGALASWIWGGTPRLAWVLLGLAGLGMATEGLQHFIPGRGASLGDLTADWLGLALGWGLLGVLARKRGPN